MKTKGKLLGQEIDIDVELGEVADFIGRITPSSAKELGGVVNDQVRLWRLKNQINIFKKAELFCKQAGLTPKAVNLKLLVPLIENASLEEEEPLQEKWAAMLAKASIGNAVRPSFVEILKELTSFEVKLLDMIHDEAVQTGDIRTAQFGRDLVVQSFRVTTQEMNLVLENLFRLNLFQAPGSAGAAYSGHRLVLRTTEIFEITSFGISFVEACRTPKKS